MIRFSAVIPTRDRPGYLATALRSLLAQSAPPDEILVVDDGGGAVATAAAVSPSIRVLDNGRGGPVAARRRGVAAARGETIVFLDDDDWLTDPDYLAAMTRAFADGADFCFTDGLLVYDDGRPDLPFAFDADAASLARDNTILISGVCYRRSLHDRLGAFDADLPFYWDWDWYLRVARSAARLHRNARPAVAIRVHARNMSGDGAAAERRANLDALAAKHGLGRLVLKNHRSLAERETPS